MSQGKIDFITIKRGLRIAHLFDIQKYYLLAKEKSQRLIKLRIRSIGNRPVSARTGTEDHQTLYATFYDKYHLPPIALKSDSVIVDLGSNIGATLLHLKHLYPSSRIIGVEMDENNHKLAKLNIDGLDNVEIINNAISIKNGTVSYNINDNVDAYNIITTNDTNDEKGLRTVSSTTIQGLLSKYNLESVDFMKIDIEGEEIKIFDQHDDLNWLNMVKSFNIEVHGDSDVLQRIISILEKNSFRAWKDTHHWSAIMAVKS